MEGLCHRSVSSSALSVEYRGAPYWRHFITTGSISASTLSFAVILVANPFFKITEMTSCLLLCFYSDLSWRNWNCRVESGSVVTLVRALQSLFLCFYSIFCSNSKCEFMLYYMCECFTVLLVGHAVIRMMRTRIALLEPWCPNSPVLTHVYRLFYLQGLVIFH